MWPRHSPHPRQLSSPLLAPASALAPSLVHRLCFFIARRLPPSPSPSCCALEEDCGLHKNTFCSSKRWTYPGDHHHPLFLLFIYFPAHRHKQGNKENDYFQYLLIGRVKNTQNRTELLLCQTEMNCCYIATHIWAETHAYIFNWQEQTRISTEINLKLNKVYT